MIVHYNFSEAQSGKTSHCKMHILRARVRRRAILNTSSTISDGDKEKLFTNLTNNDYMSSGESKDVSCSDSDDESTYICVTCKNELKSRSGLTRHKRFVHIENQLGCRKDSQMTHQGVGKFPCDTCKKVHHRNEDLQIHHSRNHQAGSPSPTPAVSPSPALSPTPGAVQVVDFSRHASHRQSSRSDANLDNSFFIPLDLEPSKKAENPYSGLRLTNPIMRPRSLKVKLWREKASMTNGYSVGDKIVVKNSKVVEFRGSIFLNSMSDTKIMDSSISKLARLLPPRPGTTFSTDLIEKCLSICSLQKDFRFYDLWQGCVVDVGRWQCHLYGWTTGSTSP
ncbi:KRAB [Mytilus edulis]|uniref:KRAB n=1 Tax=Mytilus edulis TaxID=6550 RepID=A0A8S3SUE0_MYTED|nr:KRAB [Mytilus edulis]